MQTKIKILFTFLLLSIYIFSSFGTVYANLSYSKNIRSIIMERFKQEQYKNIFQKDNVMLEHDVNFFDTQSKINTYENIRQQNIESKNELSLQKDVIDNRVLNLEQTISMLNEDIVQTQREILDLSRKIVSINEDIDKTKGEIEILNKEIFENKQVLLEYITHIYKKQNLISAGDDIDSLKTILMNNDNLSDVLSDLHFSTILESAGQILLEKHRRMVKDLFVKKLSLEEKNEELKEIKKQEIAKRKLQLEKKHFRQRILDFTKGKQELFEQYIFDKVEMDRKLKLKIIQNKVKIIKQKSELLSKYNCKYIDLNSMSTQSDMIEIDEESFSGQTNDQNCITLNKIITAEGQLKSLSSQTNPLLWPVSPNRGISAYFKDPSYEDEVGASHEAIDIRIAQGTEIVAPADGYITYVKEPKDEGYAYVVLKHTGGFVTVYGHVSEVFYKQYDVVRAGEVFAKTGGEFGTNGAGLMTTGPHLHFEVFKDKISVDPLDYMDVTKIPFDKVPNVAKYLNKFYADYELKYGIMYGGELSVIDMLRGVEGFREDAYLDSAGVRTIGYGFTSIRGKKVEEGDFMTRQEAEIELAKKARYYTNFKNFIKVPLTLEQEMALTSFEYNLGRNIWTKPTEDGGAMPIIDMINMGDLLGAADYMKQFNSAGGNKLRGLDNRRNKEVKLLLSNYSLTSDQIDLVSQSIQ